MAVATRGASSPSSSPIAAIARKPRQTRRRLAIAEHAQPVIDRLALVGHAGKLLRHRRLPFELVELGPQLFDLVLELLALLGGLDSQLKLLHFEAKFVVGFGLIGRRLVIGGDAGAAASARPNA